MSSVAGSAHTAAPTVATPFQHTKNLPEAISLTSTPHKVFGIEVSAAENVDARLSASRMSLMSPSRISSEAYTSSRRTGSRRHSSSSEAQAGVMCGLLNETDSISITRCTIDIPDVAHAPTAKTGAQMPGSVPSGKRLPPPSASFEGPSRPSSLHAPRKAQPGTARAPDIQTDTATAQSASAVLEPFRKELDQPLSDLCLHTRSPLSQEGTAPCGVDSPATPQKSSGTSKAPRHLRQSDMRSVARSATHLSVLADLLDAKVFSEEDVLFELEAIRKRSLRTSAPFNKRLLPILAWYLLRDKFGDEAATQYVSLLTSSTEASPSASAGSATISIASFLPRVNEIRRLRREAKERNRKNPKHHYAIAAPASPTQGAKLSDGTHAHPQRRQQPRRHAAFCALKDASDIPTTSAERLCSPQFSKTPRSLCAGNLSPLPYGRLRVYTYERACVDRQRAKAEDRPVVDVVVNTSDREARAKNVFNIVEEEPSSVAEEPSLFHDPGHQSTAAKAPATGSTSEKRAPVPPASARSSCGLGEVMAYRRHGLQLCGRECCNIRHVTLSVGSLSEVSRAKEGEEGLSLFYRECHEGPGDQGMPSVSVFWQDIAPPVLTAASNADKRKGVSARQPRQRHVGRGDRTIDVPSAVTPCVSNIIAAADSSPCAQRSSRGSEAVDSPDLSTVAGDTTSSHMSGEYSFSVGIDRQLCNRDAGAAPHEGAAAQAPTRTITCAALNDLHEPVFGVTGPDNATGSAACFGDSPPLRGRSATSTSTSSATEPDETLNHRREQRPYPYLSSAEHSLNQKVTATEYYSMLPNASALTHKPDRSLRSRRDARQERGSAQTPSLSQTLEPGHPADKGCGHGLLLESHADTVETSATKSITSAVSTETGWRTVVEYSAFISAEVLAAEPSDTTGAQFASVNANERGCRSTASASNAAVSVFRHSSTMANPGGHSTHGVRETPPVSICGAPDSRLHGEASGGQRTSTRGSSSTEGVLHHTPACSLLVSSYPPCTRLEKTSDAASTSSRESRFESVRGWCTEPSRACGVDHQRRSLLKSFNSPTLNGTSLHRVSAQQRSYSMGGRSVSAVRSGLGYGSVMEGSGSVAPDGSCAAPASGGHSMGGRSVSAVRSGLGYGSVMEGSGSVAPDGSCAAPASGGHSMGGRSVSAVRSGLGYGSVMEGSGSVAPDGSCAAPASGGHSMGGRSVSTVRSGLGYGSVMEGSGSVAPDGSCAAPASGGHSMGGRSVSAVRSGLGYGSVMEGSGSVAPDGSCAAPASGGHSMGGRSVSAVRSGLGYGSVMEGSGSVAPDGSCAAPASGGHSMGGRSVSAVRSGLGYGSVMEGSGSVAPDGSCAAPASGGHSMGGRSVSAVRSGLGYGSVMEEPNSSLPESARQMLPGMECAGTHTAARGDTTPYCAASTGVDAGGHVLSSICGLRPMVNESRRNVAASEETAMSSCTALWGWGEGGSGMRSSTMDPVELTAALQRLGEGHTSGSEENIACTFGEVGCLCATGKDHIPITVATKQAPRQKRSAPPHVTEARAHEADLVATRGSLLENAPTAPSPNAAPPVPLQLREVLSNVAQRESHQRKRRSPSAGAPSRSDGTRERVGAPLSPCPSRSPAGGAEKVLAQGASVPVRGGSPLLAITGARPPWTSWEECTGNIGSHAGSLLERHGFRSRATVPSETCGSAALSLHTFSDVSVLHGDTSNQQLRERQGADLAVTNHCRVDCLIPATSSLLRSSPGGSRIDEPKKTKATEGAQAAAAVTSEVSAHEGLTNLGSVATGENVAAFAIPPFPLPPGATDVNATGDTIGEGSLRMPPNMTAVLLGGSSQSGFFSVIQTAQEASAEAPDVDAAYAEELSRDVHAKHADLAALLNHSRLDSSHVIDNQASTMKASVVPGRTGMASANRSRSVTASRSDNMGLDITAADEMRADSREGDGCRDSEGPDTDRESTQLAVSVPKRRIHHHCPPLRTSECSVAGHRSEAQREQLQRRRTILDIPDVPYVDSPDTSMQTDMRETLRKKREHDLYVMRWARRGLLWQRQENEAQRYEGYERRFAAGKDLPGGAEAKNRKRILHGEVALHVPGLPNGPRPPAPMHPRSHGYPAQRRQH
ncbi:hypothetical protein LSCM1_01529 [Leishmania martiniquensis]|uniref:Uncharacterized protein n=1 Tax=Leishmania martiniquensis TaxID=1580590 RepID=A0A836KEX0_9TRYP|nr:hypothetical protein LSCM1_01529 [Leishmania martiniquensis]